jgi:acyl-CoA thioesterase-2
MSQELQHLLKQLNLESLEKGLFRGQSENLGLPQVYGGQVLGQALSAANQTVDNSRKVHSFHSYFLLPGDTQKPIVYDVENLRDGNSFTTRRVKAIQNGRPIFYMTASYQVPEIGFEHQDPIPNIESPEHYLSETALIQSLKDQLPRHLIDTFGCPRPIDVRPVVINHPLKPEKHAAKQYLWVKSNGTLPDDPCIHQYLLAYASDWGFLTTALMPHGISLFTPNLQLASLDHAMWFHRDFRFDDWLLIAIESPIASGGRGLVRAKVYTQEGVLVATATQEGLMRLHAPQDVR